ncbi:MAG TPA: argininosuccinate lyase [Acidimicrobiaceae bacterium]|nr:argininosuccinate lyase [Acidimicrobiaceae bacterium]|tara:strand:- start:249 stop:1625 length:1377 start_codon:yes stop_codon:yes gene_type:complete
MADGKTLWHGRFEGDASQALRELNDSLPFDRRMYREDIAGSRAHVEMLGDVGLLEADELRDILEALDVVEAEITEGTFEWAEDDEDIHTAVERRATEITPSAAKIHTGRSRNDQVANDVRLVTLSEIDSLVGVLGALIDCLLRRAENAHENGWYLPGYTHLQRAQPVGLAHHLAAYCWMLMRDIDRLQETRRRADVSVLGAGALAGSALPIDPHLVAEKLGFSSVFNNSLDAVSDRDFVADLLYSLSVVGVHLSRLGEEICLWASSEFNFVELDDAFSTGSSMMPQKKNPDIAELARGKAGRLLGNLTGFLATQKGLPLTYNKDLQEDKEPLFDSCDTVRLTAVALTGMIETLKFNSTSMKDSADSPYAAATDLADFLVEKGVPFRMAHSVIAGLVRESLENGDDLVSLVAAHEDLGPDAAELLAPGVGSRRDSHGGAGPEAVLSQLKALRELVGNLQ